MFHNHAKSRNKQSHQTIRLRSRYEGRSFGRVHWRGSLIRLKIFSGGLEQSLADRNRLWRGQPCGNAVAIRLQVEGCSRRTLTPGKILIFLEPGLTAC